jgi:hypothetical protein
VNRVVVLKQKLGVRHGEQCKTQLSGDYASPGYFFGKAVERLSLPQRLRLRRSMSPASKRSKLNREHNMHVHLFAFPLMMIETDTKKFFNQW